MQFIHDIPPEIWWVVVGLTIIYLTAKLLNCAISLGILLLTTSTSLLLGWLLGIFLPALAAWIIALGFFLILLRITAKLKQIISWVIMCALFALLLAVVLW